MLHPFFVMNVINKGENNIVVFTLEEKRTLTSPYYLIRMISRAGLNEKRFILVNDSTTAVDRYNRFTVTETSGTEVLTSGTVTLSPTGFWDYEIYEQLSSSNLNQQSADNPLPLETGLVVVKSAAGTDNYFSEVPAGDKFYTP